MFDLSARLKLRLTGADRIRFLNGQITNDVRKVTESTGIEACILNAKGKMNAHVFISAGPDCFYLDVDAGLTETLPARLERYVIADDVVIEDVSERFSILHFLSASGPKLQGDCRVISMRRFLEPGWDIWHDPAQKDSILKQVTRTFEIVDPTAGGSASHRAGDTTLGPRIDRGDHSDRSKPGSSHGGLRKGLLHRAGGDFANQDVRVRRINAYAVWFRRMTSRCLPA